MGKPDAQLKAEIETELYWDPAINAAQVGVTVERGAVSLFGTVETFAQKFAVEDAARRVCGVRTLAQDLAVKLAGVHERSGTEIAIAVVTALEWDVGVPVTLSGSTSSWRAMKDASNAAWTVPGVTEVVDHMTIAYGN